MDILILLRKMKNISSYYSTALIWLLLPVFLVYNFALASTAPVWYGNSDNSKIDKTILAVDSGYSKCAHENLPFEIPNDDEENSLNEIEETLKIAASEPSIYYYSILAFVLKDSPSSNIDTDILSIHHDIQSPPPK